MDQKEREILADELSKLTDWKQVRQEQEEAKKKEEAKEKKRRKE